MRYRLMLWVGAGAVCAGVTVGMLAGAGAANAQTGSDADGGASTSESTKSPESKQDSDKSDRPDFGRRVATAISAVKQAVDDTVVHAVKAANGIRPADTVGAAEPVRSQPGRRAATFVNNVVAAVASRPERAVVTERTRRTEAVATSTPLERSNLTLTAPARTQPPAAAAQPKIDVPPLVSAIGTAVFGLMSTVESVVEGPPKALPGSGVTVKRSTLQIGDQEVPADWYFPQGYQAESTIPPERIIYLQHGFGARGVFYDYTASYLAQQTNSIVVAPTVTSNLFATDGMWLGGDPMHRAMADLFSDDNPALLYSAKAAGYGQEQLPQQVVLVGHSLGGGAVLNMARYMAADESGPDPPSSYHLAGVVMLDGVSFTDPALHIAEIPADIGVYNLSSTPNPWNLFGTMDAALAQERPDAFHGAQMFLGWHSDAMVGGNALIQLAAYAITGYGGPANVEGTQVLAAGWINDMFGGANRDSGFYGQPGTSFVVPTSFGPAIALVAPKRDPINSVLSQTVLALFRLMSIVNFATDTESAPTVAASTNIDDFVSSPPLAA